MAKRNYRKSSKKIQPAELKIGFTVKNTGKNYVDLSQSASLVNRRFYRQGLNWAVSHFTFYKSTPTETGAVGVTVSKLPTSWVLSNAWEKSFIAWQKMNNEALAEAPSVKPNFLDFKIFANADHHTLGIGANVLPTDVQNNTISTGDWESSKVVVPFGPASPGNTAEFEFVALGASYPGISPASGFNAVSLIRDTLLLGVYLIL